MKKLKQFFCWHNYLRTDNDPLPTPRNGEMLICMRRHKCTKCGKTAMLGSGMII